MRRCPGCDARLDADSDRCAKCGITIYPYATNDDSNSESSLVALIGIPLILVIAVVLVTGLVIAFVVWPFIRMFL